MITTSEQETYRRLAVKAHERAQRRFHNALVNVDRTGRWEPVPTSLYLQAERLVERLEMGPCVVGCPYPMGGDHDHREYNGPWD